MELRYYLNLFLRYAWLLALALVLGAGAAFLFSALQSPVYEATTWATVVTPQETSFAADAELTDRELQESYVALLTRRPVLEAAGEAAGVEVKEEQVSAQLVTGTRMLEVTVEARDAEEAAAIANALVAVLAENGELLQVGEYASTEAALEAQVAQVSERIAALQESVAGRVETEIAEATAEQDALLAQVNSLQEEVLALQLEVDSLLAPQLTPEQEARLASARSELAATQLELTVSGNLYSAGLAQTPGGRDEATEERLQDLQLRVLELEDEIETLTTLGPPAEPEMRRQLVAAQSALAQKQLDRQLAMTRYLQLAGEIQRKQTEEVEGGTAQEKALLQLYTQLHGSLLNSLESVRLARLQNTSSLAVVEAAEAPENPVRPRPLINTVLGGLVALMAAAGLVLLLDYLDDSVKSSEEAAALTGLPIVGAIGPTRRRQPMPALAVLEAPEGPQAESFRTLRTNLEFASAEQPLRTILITSAEDEVGKTAVAANLAAAFAQGGQQTVLVDADVRRPRLHTLLGLNNERGLGDLLVTLSRAVRTLSRPPAERSPSPSEGGGQGGGRSAPAVPAGSFQPAPTLSRPSATLPLEGGGQGGGQEARVSNPPLPLQPIAGLPGLRLLASGNLPPQPYELLGTERTAALLGELAQVADVVVLDSPPLAVADAARLAPQVDGVLLVVRPGATGAEALLAAADQLERAGARVLGIVVVGDRGLGIRARLRAVDSGQQAVDSGRQPAFAEGPVGD